MKIGLLGGTFDPVHEGHLKLASSARKQLGLSTVYLVLSPRSPFKLENDLSPFNRRLNWLRTAIKGKKGLAVSTWERSQKGPSYTINTIRDFQKNHPTDEVFFIMGSDSWKGFQNWRNPKEIANRATLVIGRRPGSEEVEISFPYKSRVRILKGLFPEISSSRIRFENFLKATLSKKRFEHCLAVGDLSSRLAEAHHGDSEIAYQAGVLHDCTKEWSPKKLISYVKKNRVIVPDLEFIQRSNPNILHGYVAADFVRRKKWLVDPVWLDAIQSHTLGAVEMTVPQMIIFVADFASKDRRYKSAKEVRALGFKNLKAAFRLALAKKIGWNLKASKPLHPFTIQVWNSLQS